MEAKVVDDRVQVCPTYVAPTLREELKCVAEVGDNVRRQIFIHSNIPHHVVLVYNAWVFTQVHKLATSRHFFLFFISV